MKIIGDLVCFWGRHDLASNWNLTGFSFGTHKFNCVEQFLMFKKAELFRDFVTAKKILDEQDPAEQKRLGRAVRGFDEAIWKMHRKSIMLNGVQAKTDQNPEVAEWLESTANRTIVEASPYDKIWGAGLRAEDPRILDRAKWPGLNLLGEVYEKVREIRRNVGKSSVQVDNTPEPVPPSHMADILWCWETGSSYIQPKDDWLPRLKSIQRAALEVYLIHYAKACVVGQLEKCWVEFFFAWVLDNFAIDLYQSVATD